MLNVNSERYGALSPGICSEVGNHAAGKQKGTMHHFKVRAILADMHSGEPEYLL